LALLQRSESAAQQVQSEYRLELAKQHDGFGLSQLSPGKPTTSQIQFGPSCSQCHFAPGWTAASSLIGPTSGAPGSQSLRAKHPEPDSQAVSASQATATAIQRCGQPIPPVVIVAALPRPR
jgi:hypothetical protein